MSGKLSLLKTEAAQLKAEVRERDLGYCRRDFGLSDALGHPPSRRQRVGKKIMIEHQFSETRPWGGYKILLERPNYKVKELVVAPGARLSYQFHRRRAEHWHIVAGAGTATLDDKERAVAAGDSIDIPAGMKHRLQNTGAEDLIFIEVQTGDYFGEDDIVRLQDDYRRAP